MRPLRSAFVVTVAAAACTRPAPPVEEPSRNPPEMRPPTANPPPTPPPDVVAPPTNPPEPTCPPRSALHEGDRCPAPGLECYMPTDGCQPSGFRCADGAWREVTVTCNPPPPPTR